MTTSDEVRLEIENVDLRRLLEQAGIDADEQKGTQRLQRLLLEELHRRVKNTLATVMAITSQSLRAAKSMENGRRRRLRLLCLITARGLNGSNHENSTVNRAPWF